MRMHVSADIPLNEPNVEGGLITWLDIELLDDRADPDKPTRFGRVRAARIHASHAADNYNVLYDALDADGAELGALYDVFFENGWLKEKFFEGSGADLLYLSEIEIEPAYEHRNIDLAIMRRLCDTLGQGAALAVVAYASPPEIAHWGRLGFEVATPAEDEGYLCLRLTRVTARVDDPDLTGHFKVIPNLSPTEKRSQS